jgi:hypothetical protein
MSEERQPKYPESFTLAASYMNHLKCFSSLPCRRAPFNSIVAETLAKPLKGSDAIITDGSECYDNVRSYRCLFHKMKNLFNVDPSLYRIKHSKEKLPPWIQSSHTRQLYTFAEEEYIEWLKEKHPNLVDEPAGRFMGALTSNSMEGATGSSSMSSGQTIEGREYRGQMPTDSPQGLHEDLQRRCTAQKLLQLQRNLQLPKDNGQKNHRRPTSRNIHLLLRQRKDSISQQGD